MTTARIQIDCGVCTGHTRCYAVAPDVFHLDDDSRAVIRRQLVTASRLDEVEQAAMACPERAILVQGRIEVRLIDKVALVTGGGHGMGRACAEDLARQRASVLVTDIDGEDAQAVAEGLWLSTEVGRSLINAAKRATSSRRCRSGV